ncbi:hypothetical protein IFR05_009719 [Cadophora sp. M221]|nr:hypothetical protein IFR05_009719 [Cadophora sp. M221]
MLTTNSVQQDENLAENLMIGDVNPADSVIRSRLEVLEWALSTSKFGPEAENIKCAIAGYMSSDIGYNDHFTVIYAAHIVDTVATYSEFVRNRTEMLDRYCEMYGPGWMWHEPPLNVHPETNPKICPSVALKREETWSALGTWYIHEGFRKRSGYVARMKQTSHTLPAENEAQFVKDVINPNLFDCQGEGPRLSFRTLLDSGATYPSLHEEDFAGLQIDMNSYAAQSATECLTASGPLMTRLFELFVCVLDDAGKQLIDPNNALFPLSHKFIGGLCPVVLSFVPQTQEPDGTPLLHSIPPLPKQQSNLFPPQEPSPLTPHRLSGIFPFLASYVSSTPTLNTLYLGEDRNSVLGAHRMPGQRKWSIDTPPPPDKANLPFERYGEPKVRFSHRKGRLVDQDDETRDHVSYLVVREENDAGGGMAVQEVKIVFISDPGTRRREEDRKLRSAVKGLIDVMNDRGITGRTMSGFSGTGTSG